MRGKDARDVSELILSMTVFKYKLKIDCHVDFTVGSCDTTEENDPLEETEFEFEKNEDLEVSTIR